MSFSSMQTTILTDREISIRLRGTPPLVEGLTDEASQLQPCGVDLTLRTVSRFLSAGTVDFDNSRRTMAEREVLAWNGGVLNLAHGTYHIVYNEVVHLPLDIMALAYPRSSLLRCGATVYTAVWDPGYSGRAEAMLVVHNPSGLVVYKNARVVQLVFAQLGSAVGNAYDGRFNGENLG